MAKLGRYHLNRPLAGAEEKGKNAAIAIFDSIQTLLRPANGSSYNHTTKTETDDIELALYIHLQKMIEEKQHSGDLDDAMQAFDERHKKDAQHMFVSSLADRSFSTNKN